MRYLVHNQMRGPFSEEAQALLGAEQAHVAELFQAGILQQLYVAADYAQAWLVLNSASPEDASATAQALPLAPFVDSTIVPLAEINQ